MTLIKRIALVLIAATAQVFLHNSVQAQSRHVTASNLGLGGGGTAYLDSYHANFVNPANLMLNEGEKPRFSIGLLGGISTTAGGSLANISVYNEYFTQGLTITDELAREALDKWFGSDPANMRNLGFQFDAIPIGMAYRTEKWAASAALRTRVLFDSQMNRGLAELGIHGLDGDVFSSPRPVNFNFESLTFAELSFGYSRKLLELPGLFGIFRNIKIYGGVAPKLLLGTNLTSADFTSTFLIQGATDDRIDLIRHDFEYRFETTGSLSDQFRAFHQERVQSGVTPDIGEFVDPDGDDMFAVKAGGWGVDIGGTAEMELTVPVIGAIFKGPERLRVGLSLTDIGRITFSDRGARFVADDVVEWQGFELDRDRIDNEFNGDEGEYYEFVLVDSIGTEIYGSFSPEEGTTSLSRGLPSMLNFGAQLTMNKLSLSVDLAKGFIERGVNSQRVSFVTGLEYRFFGFLPLRVGVHTGGLTSTTYSAGLGLEFKNFEFSVAGAAVRRSLLHGANASAAWSGLVFRF